MAQYICFVGVQLQGFFNQGVSLHQLGGGKAQRQPGGSGMVLNQMSDRMDAAMHRAPGVCWVTACRAEVDAARQLPIARHMDGMFDQLVNALIFGGRNGNNRNAQHFFQLVYHDGAAVGAHFVHHVQRQHHGGIQLHQLHGQVQVALNVGSIHNVDNAGRVLAQDKIPRDNLLVGVRGQGINARQVRYGGFLVVADYAVLAVHRNAGKVAHMLVGAGQLVEQRGFAAVLIAGQGKGQRCTGGNGGAGFALVVAGGFVQLANAGVGYHLVALFAGGGAVRCVHAVNFNFLRIGQAQGQLITTQLHFNGVPHGGRFAQRYLGAGGQPHIQQVVAQLALTAYHADDCILPNVQVT